MTFQTLLVILIIGAVSGWLAGVIRQGSGFGTLGNIVVGIIGSFVGDFLFTQLGVSMSEGIIGTIIRSVIGALVLLFLLGLIKKTK
jgi:uncharacterized membrane protein YeaQ/YmgE (transglycosylase-associated protein family)